MLPTHSAAWWVVAALCALAATPQLTLGNVHTVFTTECGTYFVWQALGMMYSHRKSGQPGKITRLMSCTDEQWEAFPDKNLMPTHRAPSYTHNPHNGDVYSAYNKPEAVLDWLAHNEVEEEFVLILDADMIMRAPFIPEDLGAKEGTAISAYYGYLKGVNNQLALKHVPEVPPREDTLAGPYGRRGDQVGGFILMHKQDLKRMVPLWLKYSEDVRFDPDAWNLTGDVYSTHPGDKPWISEMYGYSFGAAKANVWHRYHTTAMIYPGYQPIEPPKVLHYGLLWEFEVNGKKYGFDKHWHYQFQATRCPPWDLEGQHTDAKGGLFPHPPAASEFSTHGLELLRDLLSIEVPLTLNEAFCEHHRKHCPKSEELDRECGKVERDAAELDAALKKLQGGVMCADLDKECPEWAAAGECAPGKNPSFMSVHCHRSCGLCGGQGRVPKVKKADKERTAGAPKLDSKPKDSALDSAGKQQVVGQATHAAVGPKASSKQDTGGEGVVSPKLQKQDDAAPKKVPRAHALTRRKKNREQTSPQVDRLKLACTSDASLSMMQVKECLEAARAGKPYEKPQSPGGSSSGGGAGSDSGSNADNQALQEQQRQAAADKAARAKLKLGDGGVEGGSDSVSRRLRERTVHAPAAKAASSASFLAKLGGIGLVLWCATVLLFLCLLPRSRARHSKLSPYRARKESML